MKLVFVLLCSVLFIYYIKSTTCLQSDEIKNVEIDEFINKLLSSKKFDELADKIAYKAVQRIQSLDKINHKNLRKDTDEKYGDYGLKDIAFKEDRSSKEKQGMTNKSIKQRKPTKTLKDENVYNDALFAKDALIPREQLRLKYKYLTGGTVDNSGKKIKTINNERHNNRQIDPMGEHFKGKTLPRHFNPKDISLKNPESLMDVHEKGKFLNKGEKDNPDNVQIYMKSNIGDNIDQRNSASDMDAEAPNKDSTDENLNGQLHVESNSEMSEENTNVRIDQKIRGKVLNVDEGVLKYIKNEDVTEHDTEVKNTNNLEVIKKTKGPDVSNINKEDTQTVDYSSDMNKNTENVDIKANNEGKGEIRDLSTVINEGTTKLRIRKEGNKVYTFERSPDYDEYHENVDKLRNTKKVDILL